MSYKVLVPLAIARDKDGHFHHHYESAVIGWLSDDQSKQWLDEGLVEKVDGDGDDDGQPAKTAPKSDWVAYVVAKTAGTDEPVSEEDADATTKADLIELYGE